MFNRAIFSKAISSRTISSGSKSSKNRINNDLLMDSEINQLINAAPTIGAINTCERSQQGRIGEQISPAIGLGSDFAEVRAYHSGDDPRHIDWRATARSQTPLLRTYHSELNQPLCLLIDRRSSMRFATRVRLKVTQALRMALWIGGREARLGRDISAVLLDSPSHWIPPQQGLSNLKLMAKLANSPCPPSESDINRQDIPKKTYINSWNKIFSGLRQHIPIGSELILLSDFSELVDEDNKMLRMLGKHCSSKAIQIYDPSETFNPLKIKAAFPSEMQLQWGQETHALSSYEKINAALKNHSETMAKRFHQANMDYFQLSVEQNELSLFLSGQNK